MVIPVENNELLKELKTTIAALERRVSRLELQFKHSSPAINTDEPPAAVVNPQLSRPLSGREQDALELNIGQFWFAKAGMFILMLGIGFLLVFPYKNIPPVLSAVAGYLIALLMLAFSSFWNRHFAHLSRYFRYSGLALLYFSTLRLYYFDTYQQALDNKWMELILLTAVVLITMIMALRHKAPLIAGMGLTFGYATAVVGNEALFLFVYVSLLSALAVYFKIKYQWPQLFLYAVIFTYAAHLIWFMRNQPVANDYHLAFLLFYIVIFATGNFFRKAPSGEDSNLIGSTVLNCLVGYGAFLLLSIASLKSYLFAAHLGAAVLFLTLSVLFWIKEQSTYSTFIYAMTGYAALTVAIVAYFPAPDFYIYLGWQSLLVVSTALWFKSKFIIVSNAFIFLLVLLLYFSFTKEIGLISLSFAAVALVSARILNWQKSRLKLQSERIRNVYLGAAFFIFPYTLYHIMPKTYVSLSWISLSIFYYIMSLILKNKKYRWMALLNLLITVGYVLLSDLVRLEPVYRILSFIVLGMVLLILSYMYSRYRGRISLKE